MVNNGRIDNVELAEAMAYAEAPFRDLIYGANGGDAQYPLYANAGVKTALLDQATEASHLMGSMVVSRSLGEVIQLKLEDKEWFADNNFVPYFGTPDESLELKKNFTHVRDKPVQQKEAYKKFKKGAPDVGGRAIAAVAGVIATTKVMPTQQEIGNTCEISRPSVALVMKYMADEAVVRNVRGSNSRFETTDKFKQLFEESPAWQQEAKIQTLTKITGYTQKEITTYLINMACNGLAGLTDGDFERDPQA